MRVWYFLQIYESLRSCLEKLTEADVSLKDGKVQEVRYNNYNYYVSIVLHMYKYVYKSDS
jgi:hypothetical protein